MREDFDTALTLLEEGPLASWRVVDYVGIALLAGKKERAQAQLDEIPGDGFYKMIGIGLLYAADPSKKDLVNGIFEKIIARKPDCDARIFALRMLALSGASDGRLKAAAREIQDESIELVVPWQRNINYWATGDPSEFQETRTRFGSEFDLALRNLSLGEKETAHKLLLEYEDHSLPGDFVWYSRYLRHRVLREFEEQTND